MELIEAIKQLVPLQLPIPNPRKPMQLVAHCPAEVFLVHTDRGPAVVWVDTFWCERPNESVCHIAYAVPRTSSSPDRWIDNEPRYGPRCLAYHKPVVLERLTPQASAWKDFQSWQHWRSGRGADCGRTAAWQRVKQELGELIVSRTA
jgi:hypothetical protein